MFVRRGGGSVRPRRPPGKRGTKASSAKSESIEVKEGHFGHFPCNLQRPSDPGHDINCIHLFLHVEVGARKGILP